MGKSKDDHKLKRSSPPPRDGDESRSKRHRSKDDEKEHKSSKKHKSHDSSKHHSRKEKKSSESGKRKHKGHKLDKLSKMKVQELSGDDYFSKNNEFATWLKEEKRIFFSDLSSEAARSLFSEFVEEWNNQELEAHYYDGIATAPRTAHKWNIKN